MEKRMRKTMSTSTSSSCSLMEALSEELLFLILDRLSAPDTKSFSLVSRSFYALESRHRRSLTPLRSELLPHLLSHRYTSLSRLDLSLCPSLTDASLRSIASSPLSSSLRSLHLPSSSTAATYSHNGFHSLAAHCLLLNEIHVANAPELTDQAALAIARMPRLQSLTLGRCKRLTDLGIGCIAVGCPDLRSLSLKACVALTDLGVALLALKCTKLASLDLSFTMITHRSLESVARLPDLHHLNIAGCLGINDQALVALTHGCASLRSLLISNCQNITDLGLSAVLAKAPTLHHLDASHSCPATTLPGLPTLPNLRSIKLDGCHVTAAAVRSLSTSAVSLTELSFSKCSGLADEGITAILPKHKGLLKLDITCCRTITDLSLAAVTASCSSLLSLRMESCANVTSEGLRLIGLRCPNLEELDLTDNDLDDEGLKSLSRCTNLKTLKIGLCLKITDEGLIQIARSCPHLRELDLYRSIGVTDKGVSEIARGCPDLETINMSYCTSISDESLKCLSRCARLSTLEIRCCPLVSSAGISDIASGCRQLSKLDVKKCYEIGNSAMLSLAHFSHNLRQINLSYCSVTDVGVLALASIGCLRVVTMLHISGMTPNGLSMALLMCGSLMKIRLHASFKPLISPVLIERVELRGCAFQWLNKPFQVELESSQVWKQQSHDIFVY